MKAVTIIILVCFVLAFSGIGLFFAVNGVDSTNPDPISIEIAEGDGIDEIAKKLKDAGLIKSETAFKAYMVMYGLNGQVYPGTYEFSQVDVAKISKLITEKAQDKEASVTFIEGWTNDEYGTALEEAGLMSQADFLAAADITDSREIIPDTTYKFLEGKPKKYGLQGFLFPDTYRFFTDATAPEVVEKMLDTFDSKITDQDLKKAADMDMTMWEVVTLASIVEKEVRNKAERKEAAGIFLERLAIDKPLQSDATVNYITGKDTTMPTADDLAEESLYNTYQNAGLPPSPICNPSLSSIQAVLDPTETDNLYFLTKPDGTAVFSQTYEEHLENKYKYYPETKP
ncbi:endolytic transglycosylase MltG [Patescibacteria group bacterium]|nr:endolytic transglycosylase MltG [Patescibacteria group bacterium]MBU1673407.1 endolytic transglycosylase MltG [Patescibacteria group bacterium]MBU1963311.1 endolytic transglycosylase MltG [Patescibacteria group bacterium]